jgi:hypothetical protein
MRHNAAILDRLLSASDPFKDAHTGHQLLVVIDIQQIRRWLAMFCNQHRLFGFVKISKNAGCLTLQAGNKLGFLD